MKPIYNKSIGIAVLLIVVAVFCLVMAFIIYDYKFSIKEYPTDTCCQPKCESIGSKSEGWYDCNQKLIKFANCDNETIKCLYAGSSNEGWYDQKGLVKYGTCSTCKIQKQTATSTATSANQNLISRFGVQGIPLSFSDEVKGAGIDIVRIWIEWDRIEPSDNNYQWEEMDGTIRAAQWANAEVLGYFINMPDWAKDTSNPKCNMGSKKGYDVCPPKDWSDYEEFAQKVAERYDGRHGKGEMKYISIWNEVQLFSNMTIEEYTPWLTKGYTAIKNGNPNAQVTVGAFLDPFEFPEAEQFINTILGDYSNYFDIVDFHVYRKEIAVTETSSYMRERMQAYNLNKPMWITETATNLATLPCNLDWYDDIARDVAKRYVRAFAEGVDKVFWFALVTSPTQQEDPSGMKCGGNHNFNMGTLGWNIKSASEEYHPRPAYTAYKTMTGNIGGFSEIEKLTDTQYRFTVRNKDVYVLWCDTGSCSIPNKAGGRVKVTDYLGNEQTINTSELNLNGSPVFIEKL